MKRKGEIEKNTRDENNQSALSAESVSSVFHFFFHYLSSSPIFDAMSKGTIEQKTALLLTPSSIGSTNIIAELLHISKSPQGITNNTEQLDKQGIKKHYGNLPLPAKDALAAFTAPAVEKEQQQVKQRVKQQRAGVNADVYTSNAIKRYLHTQLESFKPYSSLVKWHHKLYSQDGRKVRVAPCSFSSYRPKLSFEISLENNSLALTTIIDINGSTYNINEFARSNFLLESRNEYFLLSYRDYQTLEWLQENLTHECANDAKLFREKILAKLESDYTVNCNGVFEANKIIVIPVNRLLLSELNNSFLLLTTQWLYDGLLVEGPFTETVEQSINGEVYSIERNKEAEENFKQLIINLHPNFTAQKGKGYYYLSFADAQKKQWFLKNYYSLLEAGIEITGMDMLTHFRYSPHQPVTMLTFAREEGSFAVMKMSVAFGSEEISLNLLQKTLLSGARALMLKDGSLGVLSSEWLQEYAVLVKHGRIDKQNVTVSKFIAISEGKTYGETTEKEDAEKKSWWQQWIRWQQQDEILYAVPATVNATLRPYQQKGFEWLALLCDTGAGACLADDMGLGKTLQSICFLAHYIQQYSNSVNIIVCPSSLIYNWQKELQKFAPSIPVTMYHGSVKKEVDIAQVQSGIIITSYGTLRSSVEILGSLQYGVAIIDESHNIRNPSAQVTVAVNQLNAAMRIALSGTPVVNNSFDMYAQFNFVLPGMFGSKEFFRKEYADPIDRFQQEDKIAALQKLTAPFILRRTKEQVAADLPEKTESILWCTMSSSQQQLYDTIREQIKSNLFDGIKNDGLNKSKLAVLQGMLKLRQVCNSPLLLPADEREFCSESVKTSVLIDEIVNLGQHKALVFSQFSSMLNVLAEECRKKNIPFYHFDGSTPPAERAAMVEAFQKEDDNAKVFLISLKAGNAGLTLTAADYVFLFDPWWNKATEQQAIDRTHRIGQVKNVFAYKMICRNTIEEKIIQLQERKKALADTLVPDKEGFVKNLSEEDIAYLFG